MSKEGSVDLMKDDFELRVAKIMYTLQMKPHLKGFTFIKEAIGLCHEDTKYSDSITKELYPTIADKYNTTGSRVERAIRHCIEVSYSRCPDLYRVLYIMRKPTNSEFLGVIVDLLKLSYNNGMMVSEILNIADKSDPMLLAITKESYGLQI